MYIYIYIIVYKAPCSAALQRLRADCLARPQHLLRRREVSSEAQAAPSSARRRRLRADCSARPQHLPRLPPPTVPQRRRPRRSTSRRRRSP